jgi:tetratricopeptide (TPR) repeat protein
MNQAKREESEPFALRALEMAERLGHPELLSQALATWSSAARHSLDESIPLVQRALALAEENGLLLAGMRAHLHLGYRYRHSAQIERARGLEHFRRVVEMAGQAGLTATQCTALTELARDHLRAGELDEAGELLAQARLLLGDLNEPTTAAAMVDSAEMQRVGFMGRWSDCTNMARALRASTRDRGAARTTAFAAIYLGWSLLEPVRLGVAAPSGDWSEAESAFEEATELFDSSFSPSIGIRTRGQWAYLRLLQGKLADAQRLLAEGNEAAAAFVTPPATEGHRLWLAAEVAVVMGNWPEAMSLFEEACEAIVQSDEHWWTARVRLSWAQAHLTRAQPGDRQRAAELYRAAHDAFQNMGAEGYAAVARDRLRQLEAAQS